jgi:hypothetical protein
MAKVGAKPGLAKIGALGGALDVEHPGDLCQALFHSGAVLAAAVPPCPAALFAAAELPPLPDAPDGIARPRGAAQPRAPPLA